MRQVRSESAEVLYCDDEVVRLGDGDVAAIARRAAAAPRRRARACAHPGPQHPLHEMLIVLRGDGYVPPHRHRGRPESFHVVSGTATLLVFDDAGVPRERIAVGPAGSRRDFYVRIERPLFHALWVESSELVFHETTLGPFQPAGTEPAPWAPPGDDVAGGRAFLRASLARLGEAP